MDPTIAPRPKPPRRRACFGPEVWERLREDYLAGDSAGVCSARYGPSVPSIRRRIWKEEWTRRSVAAARDAEILARRDAELVGIETVEAEVEVAPPMTPMEAARAVMDEAVRLARLGRISEAAATARAAEVMARAAERFGDGGGPLPPAPAGENLDDAAAFEAVRRKVLGDLASLPTGEGG
ncbi:hypothetical protein [Brevundimonas sp. GCM10030266]|uniref:hypothetical protein n=1 Tax=Brevundimonas sp. GCM10030266 TaxID=3273386 RepID=UPI003614A14B